MDVFEDNPFLWSPSSIQIKTRVSRLELSDEKQQKLSVNNSKLEVSVTMPVKLPKLGKSNYTLIKPQVMYYHKVKVEREHTFVELMLTSPQAHSGSIFEVYYKNGEQPSTLNYTMRMTFACTYKDTKNRTCNAFFHEPISKKGIHYFGIMIRKAEQPIPQRRVRRSCFGNGRQNKSCVEEKKIESRCVLLVDCQDEKVSVLGRD